MKKYVIFVCFLLSYTVVAKTNNGATAVAADVIIETGTDDAVEVNSQHQGDIHIEVNGNTTTTTDDDQAFDDEDQSDFSEDEDDDFF